MCKESRGTRIFVPVSISVEQSIVRGMAGSKHICILCCDRHCQIALGKPVVHPPLMLNLSENWCWIKEPWISDVCLLCHCPVSSFFLPSTPADHFPFFSCPLFLSVLVYLRVLFPAFEVSNHTALLHLPEAGGEPLFSCGWLRLVECPWGIWITRALSAGTAHPDVWWVRAEWRVEMDGADGRTSGRAQAF